ncbi:hypothetical protein ACLK1S_25000 [Escherichia coli]
MKTVSIFTIITLVWSWSNCAALLTAKTGCGNSWALKSITRGSSPDYPRFEIAESFFQLRVLSVIHHRSLTPERLFIFSSARCRFRTIPRPLAKVSPHYGWQIRPHARYQRPAAAPALAEGKP